MHFVLAGMPGGWELWIILAIILLLFGRRIPQVARSLGQGISQFKKGLNEPDVPDDEETPKASSEAKPAGEKPSADDGPTGS